MRRYGRRLSPADRRTCARDSSIAGETLNRIIPAGLCRGKIDPIVNLRHGCLGDATLARYVGNVGLVRPAIRIEPYSHQSIPLTAPERDSRERSRRPRARFGGPPRCCHSIWTFVTTFRAAREHGALSLQTPQSMVIHKVFVGCTALLAMAAAQPAGGAGIWNMPTTARQYMGVGFGAGYHAPMVVGPAWRVGPASPGVERTRFPLLRGGHWGASFQMTPIYSEGAYTPPLHLETHPSSAPLPHPRIGFAPPQLVVPNGGPEVYYQGTGEFNRP